MTGGWLAALAEADRTLFAFINGTLYLRPAADLTFWLADDRVLLGLLVAAGAAYALRRGWRRALWLAAWGAAAVVISNQLHNRLLKPFFHRPRPFLAVPEVHLSANLRNLAAVSQSFPSTHAATAMALAVLAAGLDARLRAPAAFFAAAIGFGAVYSGGHYPLDVLAGYGVGAVLGVVMLKLAGLIQSLIGSAREV